MSLSDSNKRWTSSSPKRSRSCLRYSSNTTSSRKEQKWYLPSWITQQRNSCKMTLKVSSWYVRGSDASTRDKRKWSTRWLSLWEQGRRRKCSGCALSTGYRHARHRKTDEICTRTSYNERGYNQGRWKAVRSIRSIDISLAFVGIQWGPQVCHLWTTYRSVRRNRLTPSSGTGSTTSWSITRKWRSKGTPAWVSKMGLLNISDQDMWAELTITTTRKRTTLSLLTHPSHPSSNAVSSVVVSTPYGSRKYKK